MLPSGEKINDSANYYFKIIRNRRLGNTHRLIIHIPPLQSACKLYIYGAGAILNGPRQSVGIENAVQFSYITRIT